MSEQVQIEWLEMSAPAGVKKHLEPGLRAGIDGAGDVLAWAGLVAETPLVLAMASHDGEPWIVDGNHEDLRVQWLCGLMDDEKTLELLKLIEVQVKKCRLH